MNFFHRIAFYAIKTELEHECLRSAQMHCIFTIFPNRLKILVINYRILNLLNIIH